jgi:hypothetical protein
MISPLKAFCGRPEELVGLNYAFYYYNYYLCFINNLSETMLIASSSAIADKLSSFLISF